MGLLHRVEKKTQTGNAADNIQDEMGKALKEKLRRLPQKKSTPYTVLSLLKAYGTFQTGICLSLKNGYYSSYASVGAEITKATIPLEAIWSAERAKERHFKPDADLKIANEDKELIYWVFPLDFGAAPWTTIMILGVKDPSYDPVPVSDVLEDIAEKMIPAKAAAAQTQEPAAKALKASPEEEIAFFNEKNPDFNCIFLDSTGTAGFSKKVSDMLGNAGSVVSLSPDRPLILLPIDKDRELISHRLSKILNSRPLASFEASSPEDVLSRVDSFLK